MAGWNNADYMLSELCEQLISVHVPGSTAELEWINLGRLLKSTARLWQRGGWMATFE